MNTKEPVSNSRYSDIELKKIKAEHYISYISKVKLKNSYFLIRHGETKNNLENVYSGRNDVSLSPYGFNQAIELRDEKIIGFIDFDKIYVSPMKRANQTLNTIKRKLYKQTDIIVENRIIEKDFGDIEGCKKDKINGTPYEHGESFEDLKNRIIPFIKEIEKNHKDNRIGIVAHSGVIRIIRGYFEDLSADDTKKIKTPNSSIIAYIKNI